METTTNDYIDSDLVVTPVICKCGGIAHFIGMQVMKPLGYQIPLYNCESCDSSMGGAKEPIDQ